MLVISYFTGNVSNVSEGQNLECSSFEEFASKFRKCRKSSVKNNSGYFVRGELFPLERKDKNLRTASLICLDVDRSADGNNAPDAKACHEALKKIGVNHFIYTSHSHIKGEKNKYRAIIESKEYTKEDLKANNARILKLLSRAGVNIHHGTEMDTWSQPWFAPTRENPEDGMFEYYEWFEGSAWDSIAIGLSYKEQRIDEIKEEQERNRPTVEELECEAKAETLEQMRDNIISGKEYHESTRNIIYQLIKDGNSKAMVKMIVEGFYNSSAQAGSDRWNDRFNDIDRMIDGAISRTEEDDDFEVEFAELKQFKSKKVPETPGLLGQFIQETKEFMMYPDDTIAFVSAIFICASICGRKFNVDINSADGMAKPTALNMYLTLAAETGVGKSEIEDAVENCYMQFSGSNGAIQNFFYKGRITGPRALYRIYEKQRSIGIISNEKGLNDQSKLGDVAGMKDAWLNLYGQGAWKKYTGASTLSSDDDSIKSIRAVAISRIGESTPVELKKAYSKEDQVQNGLIPRESMFVIDDIVEIPNDNIRFNYSDNIINKFNSLVNTCSTDSGASDGLFKPYIITVKDKELYEDMINTQIKYRKQQKEGETIYERAMSSRMFVKMLRYCGIITVMNKNSSSPNCLEIGREHWEWAKKVVETEYDNIENIVNMTQGVNEVDDAIRDIREFYKMCITGKAKNKKMINAMPKELQRDKLIPLNVARDVASQFASLKALKNNGQGNIITTPLNKINDFLVKEGAIKIVNIRHPYRKRRCQYIKILGEI